MKNQIILCAAAVIAACTISLEVKAQIFVEYTGKVGVCIADTVEPLSNLSIGSAGQNNAKVSVYGCDTLTNDQYGIISNLNMCLQDNTMCSVNGKSIGDAASIIGVRGEAIANHELIMTPSGYIRTSTCGVYGTAAGSQRDNYGVLGTLQVNGGNGAGVFGTTGSMEFNIGGRYAGFFRGQTKVKGDFYAVSLNTYNPYPSMLRSVSNVDGGLSNKLLSLQAIQYQLPDTTLDVEKVHFGFDAQIMQKEFPDLVHEDEIGNVSINYVELIPLLVQTIQNLAAEVEELKARQK